MIKISEPFVSFGFFVVNKTNRMPTILPTIELESKEARKEK